ncbi:MAG: hypothetical protein ACYDG4_15235 [Desulfuromonadaceae bacterium]
MSTANLIPNAAGDSSQLTTESYGANNYEEIDDPVASPDTGTYVHDNGDAGTFLDLYNVPNQSLEGVISDVTIYIRCNYGIGSGPKSRTAIKIGGTVYYGTSNTLTSSWVTYNTSYIINPKTSVAWSWEDINNLQIGVEIVSTDFWQYGCCTQVYAIVTYGGSTGGRMCQVAMI